MNIDYKIKKEHFKMEVQNEKELIQILIPIFYDEFTVYESNERVAFKNFSEIKKEVIQLNNLDTDKYFENMDSLLL